MHKNNPVPYFISDDSPYGNTNRSTDHSTNRDSDDIADSRTNRGPHHSTNRDSNDIADSHTDSSSNTCTD